MVRLRVTTGMSVYLYEHRLASVAKRNHRFNDRLRSDMHRVLRAREKANSVYWVRVGRMSRMTGCVTLVAPNGDTLAALHTDMYRA
jgi:hypothetical protein